MLKKRKFIKCQHQRPPSNADILGSQLLGYRVFIKDLSCVLAKERGREVTDPCTETKTISDPDATSTKIGYLSESRSQINYRYHCCHFCYYYYYTVRCLSVSFIFHAITQSTCIS